jgi:hypothetical protein
MQISNYCQKILWSISAFAALATFSACSSDDDSDKTIDPANITVKVEMSCNLKSSDAGVDIVWLNSDDPESASTTTLTTGNTWQETAVYSGIPEKPVGFVVNPLFNENITDGTEVVIDYSIECSIYVMDGDKVINTKFTEENASYTLTYSSDDADIYDFADSYLFNVTLSDITAADRSSLVDSDLTEYSDDRPSTDIDDVKGLGDLFYCSHNDITTDDDCLYDNFLARYPSRAPWDGTPLYKGDYLFLYQNDFKTASSDILKQSLANGAVLIIEDIDSYASLKNFCDEAGVYNPLPDDIDATHAMFIIANSKDGMLSEDSDSQYCGLFMMLTPNTDVDADYQQGEQIDRAVTILNEITVASSSKRAGKVSLSSRSESNDLLKLTGAKKVYLDGDNFQQLSTSDYCEPKRAGRTRTNYYSVECDIWNVYSVSEKRNYYYIHQDFLGAFNDCYVGVYNKSIKTKGCKTVSKVCEWYGQQVKLTTVPDGSADMRIHRTSPETTQSSTSYTSGVSYNLGGTVGVEGGKFAGSFNGGIGVNSSYTYTVNDVSIANLCVPATSLCWEFNLARAWTKYAPFQTACTSMHEGSASGRASFTCGTDFIISFPESTKDPKLNVKLDVTLRRTCGKCGWECAEDTRHKEFTMKVALPYLTANKFE